MTKPAGNSAASPSEGSPPPGVDPPRRRPLLLGISILLVLGWSIFLLIMAFGR